MADSLKPGGDQLPESAQLGTAAVVLLGFSLLFLFLILIYLLAVLWPSGLSAETKGDAVDSFRLLGTDALTVKVSVDVRLILLVAVAGAFGSCLYSASAFVSYLGTRVFYRQLLS